MATNPCRTVLISDIPAEKDEFGSHQRLADAVSTLILSENEGGKTIGIEGDWGSGKSTVINLINTTLSQADHNLVFLFDAWAHHDDPLRRTFLESLIIQAEQKKWVDVEPWGKRRAVLGQRLKFERKEVNSNLKVWARWFIVSTLFLPIGIALLSSGFNSATGADDLLAWKVTVGLLLTLLPVFILISVLLANSQKLRQNKEPGSEQEDPWSFLVQNSMTDTRSQTFQTPNPTSIEFGQTFSDFMEAALFEKERKVIIILDNLDRVDADDALSLLSTLQTFLQHSNYASIWLSRLWIIIPYDRIGLERLWRINQNAKTISQKENIANKIYDSEIAASFFDKRFQIRFEVPPIVLSDWSAYLKRLLKFAFPDHPEDEFHTIYRVYTIYRPNLDRSPTPRELKLYVNQIGTIHRQWTDTFPLPHVGYYVLLKRKGENVIERLLSGDYRDAQLQAFCGPGLVDSLTALAFNVEISLARQILLKDPIENALQEGNEVRFLELANQPGFLQVFEGISFSEWIDEDSTPLVNAAFILVGEKGTASLDANARRGVVREFRRAVQNATTWAPFTLQIGEGLAAIFDLIDADSTIIGNTFKVISSTPLNWSREDVSKSNEILHSWMSGVISLLDAINKTKSVNELFTDKITIPCPVDGYLEGCAYLCDNDNNARYWHMFSPSVSADEIVAELRNPTNKTGRTNRHVKAVKVLKKQELTITWDSLLTDVKDKIQITNNNVPELTKTLLQILWELKEVSEFKSILSNFAKQGFILHHLNSAKKDPLAVAYCIFSFLYIYPDARNVTQQGESENGRSYLNQIFNSPDSYIEVTERFVDLLHEYGEYDLPFKMLASEISKNWVARIMKICAIRDEVLRFFSVINVIQHWHFIEESIGRESFDAVSENMINETDLLHQITSSEFSVDHAGLYASLIRGEGSKNDLFRDWCISGLKGISQENMQMHINKNDSVAELIVDLADNEIKFDLGTDFQEIIFNHAVALMKGEVQVDYLSKYWDRLLQPLTSYTRDTLKDRMVEAVIQRNGDISQDFFVIYGDELIDTRGLERNRGLVLYILTPLIKNRHITGTKWIVKLLEAKPNLLSEYSPKRHVDDMRDWIEQALASNTNDEASEPIQKIAGIMEKTHKKKGRSK